MFRNLAVKLVEWAQPLAPSATRIAEIARPYVPPVAMGIITSLMREKTRPSYPKDSYDPNQTLPLRHETLWDCPFFHTPRGAAIAHRSIDKAWENRESEGDFFLLSAGVHAGGMQSKHFMLSDDSLVWMVKPKQKGSEYITDAEVAAYHVQRWVIPNAVEVRKINLDNENGSIQPWQENLDKTRADLLDVETGELTATEIEQLQREHVVDWLIANHDAHPKQFLRLNDGRLLGIDKGEAMRYMGSDRLSMDFFPNKQSEIGWDGPKAEPIYNRLYRAAKAGEIELDPRITLSAIERVEQLDDETYLSWWRPYVQGRFANPEAQEAFLGLILSRKASLRGDFEKLYAEVLDDPGFQF